jgi:hypothetical protein
VAAPCASIAAAIEPIASLTRVMVVTMPRMASTDSLVFCRIRKTLGADLFGSLGRLSSKPSDLGSEAFSGVACMGPPRSSRSVPED